MQRRLASPPRSLSPGNSSGQVIELPRVCAVFDKPYVARYKRGQNGTLMLLDAQPITMGESARKGSAAPVALPLNAIDDSQERCPCCHAKGSLTFCERCASWICAGGRKGTTGLFRCRESCGAQGQIVETHISDEIWQGREASGLAVPHKPALPPVKESKALAAPSKPALPSGKVRGFLKP